MKILYLRLKNSIGIMAGLNKREIEIDFNKNINPIILITGCNGSGKSTILSSLHPFNNTLNDDRDKFYISNTEGEKEIHYKNGDYVYIIRHYTTNKEKGSKTRSYIGKIKYSDYNRSYLNKIKLSDIYKNESFCIELNETGGVNSFIDLIRNELDVTQDFFKISRIGSNVTNFIDLSTAERKKYISTFLPDINEYLSKFKIVSEKYKLINKEIKYISDEILKIGNKDDIDSSIDVSKNRIKTLEEDITTTKSEIDVINYKLSEMVSTFDINNNDKINEIITSYNKIKEDYEASLKLLKDISIDDESFEKLKTKLVSLKEAKIPNLMKDIDSLGKAKIEFTEKNNEYLENVKNAKQQLAEINYSEEDNLKIETLQNELADELDSLIKENNEIETSGILDNYNTDSINNDNIPEITYLTKTFKNYSEKISNTISMLNDQKIISMLFDENKNLTKNNLKTAAAVLTNDIKKQEENLKNIDEEIRNTSSLVEIEKIADARPTNCSIDSCPFIEKALKNKGSKIKLDTLLEQKETLQQNKTDLEKLKEKLIMAAELFVTCEEYYKNDIKKFFEFKVFKNLNLNTIGEWVNLVINNYPVISSLDLSKVTEYFSNNKKINDIINRLSDLKEKYELNKNTEAFYNTMVHNISVLEKDLKENKDKLDNSIKEYTNKSDELKINNAKMIEIEKIINTKNSINEKEIKFKDISNQYNQIIKLLADKKSLTEKLNGLNIKYNKFIVDKDNENNTLNDLIFKLKKLDEYNTRKSDLNNSFENIKLIKDSLDVTKGIPTIFIKSYISKTKDITNSLLQLSKNNFFIDFELTDTEFKVKVLKDDGDILEDICLASQGESSLVSLSLSLALVEQSITKYNILLLDELDGPLDESNRRSFIDMVNTQMQSINSEQCFIISHNNEFIAQPIDLILLKDSPIDISDNDIMSNKNILYKI